MQDSLSEHITTPRLLFVVTLGVAFMVINIVVSEVSTLSTRQEVEFTCGFGCGPHPMFSVVMIFLVLLAGTFLIGRWGMAE